MRTKTTPVTVRILDGFDDPSFGPEQWDALLHHGDTDVVFLTRAFQRAWWQSMPRGELLLLLAERGGEPVALAPFSHEFGLVSFVGSSFECDHLDFVGDVGDPVVLDALLTTAMDCAPDFYGFRLYFISDRSRTGARVVDAAARLGLGVYGEDVAMPNPTVDLVRNPEAAERKSLRQAERMMRRDGELTCSHVRRADEVRPHLEDLFQHHMARWPLDSEDPSRFFYAKAQRLVERLTEVGGEAGWLRFSTMAWKGRPVAWHFGWSYGGYFAWGIPSFDASIARYSPGRVLLRHLLLAAVEEGARTFDFRAGAQDFKMRLATNVTHVRTYDLYPKRRAASEGATWPGR